MRRPRTSGNASFDGGDAHAKLEARNGAASAKPSVNARCPKLAPNCHSDHAAVESVWSANTTTAGTSSDRATPVATKAPATLSNSSGDQKNKPFCVLNSTAARRAAIQT